MLCKYHSIPSQSCGSSYNSVSIAIVVQLVLLNRVPPTEEDITYKSWQAVLANQIVQNLSIITACLPNLKPFFDSLETGFIHNGDFRRRGHVEDINQSLLPESWQVGHNISLASSRIRGVFRNQPTRRERLSPGDQQSFSRLAPGRATAVAKGRTSSDVESQASHANCVKQTKTWTVESEPWL